MTYIATTLDEMLAEPRKAPTMQEIERALYAVRGYERREPDWFLTPGDIRILAAGMVQYALLKAALDALRDASKGCGAPFTVPSEPASQCGDGAPARPAYCAECWTRLFDALAALVTASE